MEQPFEVNPPKSNWPRFYSTQKKWPENIHAGGGGKSPRIQANTKTFPKLKHPTPKIKIQTIISSSSIIISYRSISNPRIFFQPVKAKFSFATKEQKQLCYKPQRRRPRCSKINNCFVEVTSNWFRLCWVCVRSRLCEYFVYHLAVNSFNVVKQPPAIYCMFILNILMES